MLPMLYILFSYRFEIFSFSVCFGFRICLFDFSSCQYVRLQHLQSYRSTLLALCSRPLPPRRIHARPKIQKRLSNRHHRFYPLRLLRFRRGFHRLLVETLLADNLESLMYCSSRFHVLLAPHPKTLVEPLLTYLDLLNSRFQFFIVFLGVL